MKLEPLELARFIVDAIAEKKGEDIVLLDIHDISLIADYFIIGSMTSDRQKKAVVNEIAATTKQSLGVRPLHIEGGTDSDWILMDYGSVIVHLFSPEARRYYDLEGLWRDGKTIVRMQ